MAIALITGKSGRGTSSRRLGQLIERSFLPFLIKTCPVLSFCVKVDREGEEEERHCSGWKQCRGSKHKKKKEYE